MKTKRRIANNCEKATFLIEKKQFDKISFGENVGLKFHLAGCPVCQTYQKQSRLITKLSQQILNSPPPPNFSLDENSKKQLQQLIDKKLTDK